MILIRVFLIVLVIDQVSKALILSFLPFSTPCPVIKNFLFFTLTSNQGAAFGIMPWASYLFLTLQGLVVIGSFLFIKRLAKLSRTYQVAIGMISGGAAGNLFDRLTFGKVIDFIDLRFWPVFNLADSSIVLGGAVILCLLLFQKKGKS